MTGPLKTRTEQQALAHLERHLHEAMAQVQAATAAEPGPEPGMRITVSCDDPTDDGPPGRVFVESHYWLRGVPPQRNDEVFDALHGYWTGNGYRVLADQRSLPEAAQLKVVHAEDSYVVVLRQNLANQLELLGSSPCVWPDGAPPRAAES